MQKCNSTQITQSVESLNNTLYQLVDFSLLTPCRNVVFCLSSAVHMQTEKEMRIVGLLHCRRTVLCVDILRRCYSLVL